MLVCGGRDYDDVDNVYDTLDVFCREHRVTLIIHGAAPGADALAGEWARCCGISCREFRADWRTHGGSAGPIRNKQMLVEGRPDLVVAFPGGSGTANMVEQAMKAGVPVYRISRSGGVS